MCPWGFSRGGGKRGAGEWGSGGVGDEVRGKGKGGRWVGHVPRGTLREPYGSLSVPGRPPVGAQFREATVRSSGYKVLCRKFRVTGDRRSGTSKGPPSGDDRGVFSPRCSTWNAPETIRFPLGTRMPASRVPLRGTTGGSLVHGVPRETLREPYGSLSVPGCPLLGSPFGGRQEGLQSEMFHVERSGDQRFPLGTRMPASRVPLRGTTGGSLVRDVPRGTLRRPYGSLSVPGCPLLGSPFGGRQEGLQSEMFHVERSGDHTVPSRYQDARFSGPPSGDDRGVFSADNKMEGLSGDDQVALAEKGALPRKPLPITSPRRTSRRWTRALRRSQSLP